MTTFEDKILEAIVTRFFEPHTVYAPVQTFDQQTGQYRTEWSASSQKSPVQVVAEQIFSAKKTEIMAAVLERISIDAIATHLVPLVSADIVKQLAPPTGGGSYYSRPDESARLKMRDDVWAKVAEEFGKQAVAYLQRTGGLQPVLGSVVEPAEHIEDATP